MSADNWTTCPRCQRLIDEIIWAKNEAIKQAEKSNDLKAYKAAQAIIVPIVKHTLREDYEIYLDDSVGHKLVVQYSAGCTVCGLSLVYDNNSVDFSNAVNSEPKKKVVFT